MSQFDVKMTALADAIKAKNTTTASKLSIDGMITAVQGIKPGAELPDGITVTSADVKDNVFYIDATGNKVEGTMPVYGDETVTLTTYEQTLPAGYYDSVIVPGSIFADLTSQQLEMATSDGSKVLGGEYFISGIGRLRPGTMPNKGTLEVVPNETVQEFDGGYYKSISVAAIEKVDEDLCSVTFGVVDDNGNFKPLDLTVAPPEKLTPSNAFQEVLMYHTGMQESIEDVTGEKFYFCATIIPYKYEDFNALEYYFAVDSGIRADKADDERALTRKWQGYSISGGYKRDVICTYDSDKNIWYIGYQNNPSPYAGEYYYIKRWYTSKAFAMLFAEADQSKSIFEQDWKKSFYNQPNKQIESYDLSFSYWPKAAGEGDSGYIRFTQNVVRGYGVFVGFHDGSDAVNNTSSNTDEYTIELKQDGTSCYWILHKTGAYVNDVYTPVSWPPMYVSETFSLAEWKHFVDVKWQRYYYSINTDTITGLSEWFYADLKTDSVTDALEDRTYTKPFWAGFPMIREGKSWRHDGYSNVDPDLVDLTGAKMFPADADGLTPSPGEIYNEDCTMKIGEYIPYQEMDYDPKAGEEQ